MRVVAESHFEFDKFILCCKKCGGTHCHVNVFGTKGEATIIFRCRYCENEEDYTTTIVDKNKR